MRAWRAISEATTKAINNSTVRELCTVMGGNLRDHVVELGVRKAFSSVENFKSQLPDMCATSINQYMRSKDSNQSQLDRSFNDFKDLDNSNRFNFRQ